MSWSGDTCRFYSEGVLEQTSNMLPPTTNKILQPNFSSIYEANRQRTSISSSSGSSVCEPSSPSMFDERRHSSSAYPLTEPDEEAGDAPWNLVAYHIPWGPGYEGYEAGTLPGPDGACIFLRSPTPLKRQRTSQACDKCRERKAKCSGTRPTCGRCSERGFLCVYSASHVAAEIPGSPTRVQRKLSYSSSKEQLKTSIRNRIRRKSSQTEATSSYNTMHQTLPRRHSQPASAPSAPVSITPIVSLLHQQLHIEEEHVMDNTLDYPPVEGEVDSKELIDSDSLEVLGAPDYSLSQQPLGLYAQSISALDTYRFPPPIEAAPSPDGNCSPNVSPGPATYHVNTGLSMQIPSSIIQETPWQVQDYYSQLAIKTHVLQDFELYGQEYEDTNYAGIFPQRDINSNAHVHKTKPDGNLGQGQQTGYFPYLYGYGTNLEQ